ncbi:MAG: hypothetical protein M0Z28_05585, partial [Rhodospirillales bacterium]|nr:hypothetical protein [Rhodospirillales bacterium]
MTLARRDPAGWRVAAPQPVGELPGLLARLTAAARGGQVVFGADVPLGLPRAYARLHAAEPDFASFLRRL